MSWFKQLERIVKGHEDAVSESNKNWNAKNWFLSDSDVSLKEFHTEYLNNIFSYEDDFDCLRTLSEGDDSLKQYREEFIKACKRAEYEYNSVTKWYMYLPDGNVLGQGEKHSVVTLVNDDGALYDTIAHKTNDAYEVAIAKLREKHIEALRADDVDVWVEGFQASSHAVAKAWLRNPYVSDSMLPSV